MLQLTPFLLVV